MAVAYDIIFTFRDGKSATATTSISIPRATTPGQAESFAQAAVPIMEAMTTGVVRSATLSIPLDISAARTRITADANSDVEEKGVFQFVTALNTTKKISLPTLDETTVSPNSNVLDQTNQAVIDFGNLILIGDGVTPPCDSREEDIVNLDFAIEYFRKSGKR